MAITLGQPHSSPFFRCPTIDRYMKAKLGHEYVYITNMSKKKKKKKKNTICKGLWVSSAIFCTLEIGSYEDKIT